MKRQPRRCEMCGELIPFPVPRRMPSGRMAVICAECSGDPDELPPVREHNREPAVVHDIQYHGDRFHSGEW